MALPGLNLRMGAQNIDARLLNDPSAKEKIQNGLKMTSPSLTNLISILAQRNIQPEAIVGECYQACDTRFYMFTSIYTSLYYFVTNLVIGIFSILATPFSEDARRFCVDHFYRAILIDTNMTWISAVGVVSPEAAGECLNDVMPTIAEWCGTR